MSDVELGRPMREVDSGGSWRDELREVVRKIRASRDPAVVLAYLSHPSGLARLTAVEWIIAHDAEVRSRWSSADLLRRDPVMLTDSVASQLLTDEVVGPVVAARVTSAAPLVEYLLVTVSDGVAAVAATRRILALGAVDELLDAVTPGRPLPPRAGLVLAGECSRSDVLESLMTHDMYYQDLLANPALTDDQRQFILARMQPWEVPGSPAERDHAARRELPTVWTVPDPQEPIAVQGYPLRANGDRATWAAALSAAADWLADHAYTPGPGGFESSELRDCGPSGAALFGATVPLCQAALLALFQPAPLPAWGEEAITWALELASFTTGTDALYTRLGIAPRALDTADLQDIPEETLRGGSTAARAAARIDQVHAPLGRGVARLLDSLAAGGGSLPWLRNYGGGMGYEDYHLYAILALRTAVPMLRALDDIPPDEPHAH